MTRNFFNITETSIKRKDVAFIPTFYDSDWGVTMSKLVSENFYTPIPFQHKSFLPSRSCAKDYMSKLLPYLRNNNITKIFLFNVLDDFDFDLFRAGGIKEIYGFVHSSTYLPYEFRQDKREQEYENFIIKNTKVAFTSSEFINRSVPHDLKVIGLPIIQPIVNNEKLKNGTIIFNHRLHNVKNPQLLQILPKNIKDRVVISTPDAPLQHIPIFKKEFKNFYFKPTKQTYQQLVSEATYGINSAKQEPFGISICESIMMGVCYFCIENDNCAHMEFMPKELIFKDEKDLVEKIKYYDENPKERLTIIKKTQKTLLERYSPDVWIEKVLKEIK